MQDIPDMEEIEDKARRKVAKIKGFYYHLTVYVCVGIFLFMLNAVTLSEENTWWFYYPLLAWGIALGIHYVSVFGIPGTKVLSDEWEEKALQEERNKLNRQRGKDEIEEEPLELKEIVREKRRRWEDTDMV